MSADIETTSWLTEPKVRDRIATALTRSDLLGLDADEAEVTKQVLAQLPRLSTALTVEIATLTDAEAAASADKQDAARFRQRLVAGQFIINILFGGWLLLLGQSSLEIDWPWQHIRWIFKQGVGSSPTALFTGLAVVMLMFGANLAFRRYKNFVARRVEGLPSQRDVTNASVNLSNKAQAEIEKLVREAVNTLDAESTTGSFLTTSKAPALVELDGADTVSAKGLSGVEDFIDGHANSAIGVAGPRGVGKSTVLRRVSANAVAGEQGKRRVGVYVQSPVYYEAADFVRTVHEKIARAILQDAQGRYESPELQVMRRVRRLRVMIPAVVAGVGALLVGLDVANVVFPKFSAMSMLGLTLIGISECYLLFGMTVSRRSRRAARFMTREVGLAQREIRQLTWNANVGSKEKTTLKFLPGITSDAEQQAAYAERERSHPDRVSDLSVFLNEFSEISDVPVVVAIDELDKIALPEKAIEAINGLKDLFHLKNTHFVVSVSEDALASFALRGVPVRDVFDSAFDDVIRMRPFTVENSVSLLLGRTVKFPRIASLFCHAASGGLPRDLIRAARRVVDVRRLANEDVHVVTAFRTVVRKDIVEAVDAARVKARESGEEDEEVHLFKLITALPGQVDLSMSMLASQPEMLTSVVPELASYVLTLVTIREFFEDLLHRENWRQLIKAPDTVAQIDELAAARSLVAVSQLDCVGRLIHVRAQTGLVAIPKSITRRAAPTLARYNGHPTRLKVHAKFVASLAAFKMAAQRPVFPPADGK